MITVAVAARDSMIRRRYLEMLKAAGYEPAFATDVTTLIRQVKSRPIDLVIFDLAPPSLSVVAYLEAVERDQDLALTPVLWVGNVGPAPYKTALENYRPGKLIDQRPDENSIAATVGELVGRAAQDHASGNSKKSDDGDWAPADDTIDSALSIFADEKEIRKAKAIARKSESDQEKAPAIPSKSQQENEINQPTESEAAASPPQASDDSDTFEVKAKELSETPIPGILNEKGHRIEKADTLPPGTPAPEEDGDSPDALLDKITERVLTRLTVEILRKLDVDTVRRTVREVIEEQRKTVSHP
jgi:CheY-like chemotaxis protein